MTYSVFNFDDGVRIPQTVNQNDQQTKIQSKEVVNRFTNFLGRKLNDRNKAKQLTIRREPER